MKKRVSLLVISIACLVLFGCMQTEKGKDAYTDVDDSFVISALDITETLSDSTCLNVHKVVLLETTDESLVAKISRIVEDDDRLFILDRTQMKLFIFGSNGEYIAQIHRIGQGPGEYIQAMDFTLDIQQKQILLLCDIPNKIMRFTYQGEFVDEESLDVYYSNLTSEGNKIFFNKLIDGGASNYQLLIRDVDANTDIEILDQVPNINNRLFISGNSLINAKRILYTRRFDNSIYEIEGNNISKKYSVDWGKYTIPGNLKEETDESALLSKCSENDYIYSMSNITESVNYLMFKTNLGLFVYDKQQDVLKGYKEISNTLLHDVFYDYVPLENTDRIVCAIENPSYIRRIPSFLSDEDIASGKYSDLIEISSKIVDESNPVLFIYEFK